VKSILSLAPLRFIACVLPLACAGQTNSYNWLPPTNKIAILAVSAHPDDEGIFLGPTLAYYAGELQVPAMLLCLVDGNNTIRQNELRCAAWRYGVRYEPLFGHFTDVYSNLQTNGPWGTNTINITWEYWSGLGYVGSTNNVEAGKARAIALIAEQIRRYRPDVIVTHDFNGEYGHDNHRATAYATSQAFFMAADPGATAPNLAGLPPWQAQKIYVHLYPTNQFFHAYWETPSPALGGQTPHQVCNTGLLCHASQGIKTCATVFNPPPYGLYGPWPSEWWGLYASTVGPDTVLTNPVVENGYTIPSGVASGHFFEHVASLQNTSSPPVFTVNPVILSSATIGTNYSGTLATFAMDWDSSQTLTFSITSGPAWLNVATNGALSGTPGISDAGSNTWVVRVTDSQGLYSEASLSILVFGAVPGQADLVGWWRMSEPGPAPGPTSLGAVRNMPPLYPNGIISGGLIFGQPGAEPWTGTSILFDGTDGKADVPYSPALNSGIFTVALWAKPTGGAGTYRSPLSNRRVPPPAGYTFYAGTDDNWQFWLGDGTNWTRLSGGPVTLNTWTHLCATYDGSTVSFYTNGALAVSANASFQPNNTYPLRLGAGASEGPGQFWFPGCIDDVRLFRVPLGPAQVQTLFANPLPVTPAPTRRSDGAMLLQGLGFAGQSYVLLAAESLDAPVTWTPIATNVADSAGSFVCTDESATNFPQRFYRLTTP
jgi:LmbE family N-acetylglucosaminyl deacetylase